MCNHNWVSKALMGKWAQHGYCRESEEEGHAFWRVGVILSFPATVINVVNTSLQLNALERKPRASCCLTEAAKCKLEIKKKEEKGKKCEALLSRSGIPASRMKPSSLFPRDLEGKAHPNVNCFSNRSGLSK